MKYVRHNQTISSEQGFTIIELVIATLIFSVILVILTFAVVGITRSYYKGTINSETQNTARSALNTVAQAIQFGGSLPTTTLTNGQTSWFCVGPDQFTFKAGHQLVTGTPVGQQTNEALLLTHLTSACPTSGVSIDSQPGTELLSPNMRLSELSISAVSASQELYEVSIEVTYGDSDLLFNPTSTTGTASCIDQSGGEFCATSNLSTVVGDRYNDSGL
jgi:prepilin-type N-terminal cleavage/methylation domain-containing protein